MDTMNVHYPHKRNFRLDTTQRLPVANAWFKDDQFLTRFLQAYVLLIPEGERFIIRSCRALAHRASPELHDALEELFFQEGRHAREHRRVVDTMRLNGIEIDGFRAIVNWLSYQVLEPLFPAPVRLAAAAAIEHHNATIAK